MKWKNLPSSKKRLYFYLIFFVGLLIRQAGPAGILFSIYYITVSHLLFDKRERGTTLGLKKPWRGGYWKAAGLVFLLVVLLLPSYLGSSLSFVHLFDEPLTEIHGKLGESLPLTIILSWIMIGTFSVYAEEIYFRGFVLHAVKDMGRTETALVSAQRASSIKVHLTHACLFGISHVNLLWAGTPVPLHQWSSVPPNIPFILTGVLSLATIGFFFALLREKTGSLYPVIAAHSIGNLFMVLIPALLLLS